MHGFVAVIVVMSSMYAPIGGKCKPLLDLSPPTIHRDARLMSSIAVCSITVDTKCIQTINQLLGVYKKNPSTPDLHINCNLTSDNMPKIHPETKVLIIKRLKTRAPAEVADAFNVSQRQVQRIRKRYEETGEVFDKPRSGRPRKTTAWEDHLLAPKSKASPFSTAAELHETWSPEVPVSTRTVCRILSRNGLHGRISAQKPALNKRQLKNCVAFVKAHSLPKGWTLEKWQKVDFSDDSSVELHHSHRKYCRRPTGARMDPRFTKKTVKFGGGLLHSQS